MNSNLYKTWAKQSADNAVSLAEEARILFLAEHYPRAYYLAHMSTEESAKSILLYTCGLPETPVCDLEKITKLLRNHKKKIEFLIEYAESVSVELRNSLMSLKDELIFHINNLKNNTMYVSCENKVISSPLEKIKNLDVEIYLDLSEKLSAHSKMLTSLSS